MTKKDTSEQVFYKLLWNEGMKAHMFGATTPFQREIVKFTQEQEDILRVLTVFVMGNYNAHPTFEQFVSFCYEAGALGYSLKNLYEIFASGITPQDLDVLIKKHMKGWRPAGGMVESELRVKRLDV